MGAAAAGALVLAAWEVPCPAFLQSAASGRPPLARNPAAAVAIAGTALTSGADLAAAADGGDGGFGALPLIAGVAVVGAVAALLLTDSSGDSVDDKKVVEEYFNTEGFSRWQKIYGDTDDVNPVQKDIRVGHAETVEKTLKWLDEVDIDGKTICDAGCGTGNLSIPLAQRGAVVSGSDISSAMVSEAAARAETALKDAPKVRKMPQFETLDLEAINGEFDCVCCIDVLIHYPPERLDAMIGRLAQASKERLILSFAPKTLFYIALKRIGELFPGKSKTTRAYLHEEEEVEKVLGRLGYKVTRREMTATNFYFSRLFEAVPVSAA